MAQFTVRNIEEDVKSRLKQRAVRRGSSLEEEVRQILRQAVAQDNLPGMPVVPLSRRISARFKSFGLTEDLPELRGQAVQAVTFMKTSRGR